MNESIIEHKANMYYVKLREDYLLICAECKYQKIGKDGKKSSASAYCKALIIDVMEHWTNNKRDHQLPLGVTMTYPQWYKALFGMFGRTVIVDSLDELVGEGLLRREIYETKQAGRDSYRYYLNYQEINLRMKSLKDRSPEDGPFPQTSKNGRLDEDANKHPKMDDKHPKMDVQTSKNGRLPSSQTSKNGRLIDNIDSDIDSREREGSAIASPTLAKSASLELVQEELPTVTDPGSLVMPPDNAPWTPGTLVLISEVLRGKRYNANQIKSQKPAAVRMLEEFPGLTRELFIEAFLDRQEWNTQKKKGLVSVYYLMQKGYQSEDLRMQQVLDILEQKRGKQPTSIPAGISVKPNAPRNEPDKLESDTDKRRRAIEARKAAAATTLVAAI